MSQFNFTTGNPDRLIGGGPATMGDIQGSFYDLRAYLNSGILDRLDALIPPTAIATATPVLDVGQLNQVRAGRQLALADFTNLGLTAPVGLWNLTDLSDASGNARPLTNKGVVPFGVGINGVAGTAAAFAGSTAQALYIADTGAADPFRIRTGSWGCWFRTAKRGTAQSLVGKWAAQQSFLLAISAVNNAVNAYVSLTGVETLGATGYTDVCDDRWHFGVGTHDGTRARLYLDGALEATGTVNGPVFGGSAPVNIGGNSADAATATAQAHYGRVDEAFITTDVLSDEQVRLLYCARLVHALGMAPTRTNLLVRRRRRGATLGITNFPAQPARLHNLAPTPEDLGSNGVALTPPGDAVATAGPNGAGSGSVRLAGTGTGYSATDAGLPAALTARTFGAWFKTSSGAVAQGLVAWGTGATGMAQMSISGSGTIAANSAADVILGPAVADGQWHQAVVVEDNAAADGVKRKLYLDGRLVAGSTVLNAITLVGAGGFKVGVLPGGASSLVGHIARAFVYAGALTTEQIRTLYDVGSQTLAPSPKDASDHVEATQTDAILATFDTIETSDLIDLQVGA